MAAPIYLGDEVSAVGWSLAGANAFTPAPGAETEALAQARAKSPLVLVSAALAARIGAKDLHSACLALSPLVLVVPDPQGVVALPDVAGRLRSQLGLEA